MCFFLGNFQEKTCSLLLYLHVADALVVRIERCVVERDFRRGSAYERLDGSRVPRRGENKRLPCFSHRELPMEEISPPRKGNVSRGIRLGFASVIALLLL